MTWKSARFVADQYLQKLNLPPRLDRAVIQLSDYESDEDLYFLKSSNEWGLAFHRMVNEALARALRKRGAKIAFVLIRMKDYFAWLAKFDLPNTPANRAQFIGWSTAPEPKPQPIKK